MAGQKTKRYMDDVQNPQGENPTPTPEELKQEEEALKETKEDEIRSQVIEKYGLNEDEQSDLIDNLVQDTVEQRTAFGKAIKQKRTWREKAQKPKEEPKAPEDKPTPQPQPKTAEPDVEALVNERFEQRDLEALDLPDELKPEVQKLAKLLGISVRKAAADPYILHKKEEYEREQQANEAAISRTRKGPQVKFDKNNPPEVDMSTEEGRNTWAEYTKWLSTQNE